MKEIDLEKLYEITGEKAPLLEAELAELAKLLTREFELRTFFEDAAASKESKLKLLIEIRPELSELGRRLIGLLIDEGLAKSLIKIAERFTKLVARRTATVVAEVKTAYQLQDEERKRIAGWLGGQVRLREEIEPALIGGIRILTSDGKYFDGSLQGALENLKGSIINV